MCDAWIFSPIPKQSRPPPLTKCLFANEPRSRIDYIIPTSYIEGIVEVLH
jgi:hypothetical protein